ncbi:unnamed protein product [Heterobilharzia americana]|nr:unnamed protein product [Heterobilharzia americana]
MLFTTLHLRICKSPPIYSYDNALLILFHSFDPKIQKPFVDIAHYIQNSFVDIRTFLDPDKIKNNVVLNNSVCVKDVTSIIYGIIRLNNESTKWLDAAGKVVPGVSSGGINWVGSMDLCRNISDFNYGISQHVSGKYCTAFVKLPTPTDLPQKLSLELNYGVCIPHSCTKNDLFVLLDMVLSKVNLSLDNSTSFCHEDAGAVPKDGWYWVSISLLLIVLSLLLSGTTVDIIIWGIWKYHLYAQSYDRLVNNSISEETSATSNEATVVIEEDTGDRNLTERITAVYVNPYELSYSEYRSNVLSNMNFSIKFISTYSIPHNAWYLWHSKPSTFLDKSGQPCEHPLLCLDGIRFLTMTWIIYGHCIVYSLLVSNNSLLYVQLHSRKWTYQVMVSATLSVDTFFFMSGLLSTYLTLPKLRRICGWRNWFKFWCGFTFHRIIRLTPAYLLVLILYTGLFIHAYSGPLYPQNPELLDIKFCRDHWWVTYLSNMIYSEELCMGWSWYLANELQFSLVLAPIFLSLIICKEAVGVAFGIGLVISSVAATYGISYANDYLPGALSITSFTKIYVKPYTRWSTYAIGLLCGWFLEKHINILDSLSRKNKAFVFLAGMITSTVFCLSTVYGLYGLLSGNIQAFSTSESAAYTAFHRPVFILGVAIIVSMCALGCGSPVRSLLASSIFRLPARLTFTAYLVHPIVIQFIVMGSQAPAILDDLYLIILFFAVLPISYFIGFLVSLATESPIIAVKHVLGQKGPSPVQN